MELLPNDIVVFLSNEYLSSDDKKTVISVSKKYNQSKYLIRFDKLVKLRHIYHLSYYNSFTNIIIKSNPDSSLTQNFYYYLGLYKNIVLPKNVKRITTSKHYNEKLLNIPEGVTHLTFGS